MHMDNKRLRRFILLIICSVGVAACEPSAKQEAAKQRAEQEAKEDIAESFGLMEVADGIFVHQGQHVTLDDPAHADIANIGFIVGEKCVAVVDTGGSIEIGLQLREAIQRETDKPICYVINTHVHYDHVLGNLAFLADGVEFVGHTHLKDAIEQNRDFFVEQFPEDLSMPGDAAADLDKRPRIIAPSVLVDDKRELDLGGRVIQLQAHPKAHTTTDLTVYDSQTQTLWLSDLLFMERIPVLDGSLLGWQKVLAELKAIPAERVIPGHGPVSAAWPEALADQERYLTVLLEETRAAIQAGQFIGDAVKTVGQSEREKWLLFDHYHQGGVSRAFRELEWE